ncbi:folliculin-interacting protein 2 [Episyrphus balteatus]|uniref:folliculin-interacting protein 2 n=1 Tax=Episyrphus balteatus TaxID=286459 RepID=UPI00248589E5|nr:folliculin-interacting protein 2 [Episyrphus balteatus]
MALFNKLFFPSSSSSPAATPSSANNNNKRNNNQSIHSKNYISQFPFDAGQVRVLLFRECDSRGRRLLFDSNALQKVTLKDFEIRLSTAHKIIDENISVNSDINGGKHHFKGQSNGYVEAADGCLYKHNRPSMADIPTVGEMVFGALAMSFRGTALKVHWLRSPPRMLCSQVFLSPMSSITNSTTPHHISAGHLTPRNSITSDHSSVDGFSMNSFSMLNVDRKNSDISERIGDRFTNPLDVPDANVNITAKRYSATYSTGDSGYSGGTTSNDQWTVTTGSLSYQYSTRSSLGSVISDPESMRKFSLDSSYLASATQGSNMSSDGSLQRRISRNLLTSFENQNSLNDFIGFLSDNNFHSTPQTSGGSEGCVASQYRRTSVANESRSNPEIGRRRDVSYSHKMMRRPRLGLAVCITMSESFEDEMEMFCSEHIALLESMLGRLRISSEKAYINHKEFLKIMVHAWQATTQWLLDLFKAPRINVPVWLSITTSGSKYSKSVADRFVHELCSLLSMADTKNTNFFVSTVLTAILTHHLGWVSTISNFNTPTKSSAAAIEQRAKLLEVSQKYPYNVLWAQIGDLYGAVGTPPKLSRTIIYGTEKLPTERLLNILTYFIRCGEIRRTSKCEDFNKEVINDIIMNQSNDQASAKNNSNINANSFFPISNKASSSTKGLGGLTRTSSCKTNLTEMCGSNDDEIEFPQELNISRMNDIPNVLAFRDSRLVKQELRIGNYLMDPGIMKGSLSNLRQEDRCKERIKLTVTTPDNIEMTVEPTETEDAGVVEAIEIEPSEEVGQKNTSAFFWAPAVKEGVSCNDLHKLPMNRKLGKRSTSFNSLRGMPQSESSNSGVFSELKPINEKHISLSDLITENSIGKGNRLAWGVETIRETTTSENEVKYFDDQKIISEKEQEHENKGVVFVLGDNEPLVNIKRSTEDLAEEVISSQSEALSSSSSSRKPICPHHPHHNSHKKHSGVKFDFVQYPQIYANYMKNKNLSDYDFMEKPQKFDMFGGSSAVAGTSALSAAAAAAASAAAATSAAKEDISLTSEFCEFCQNSTNGNKSYQTPSNATELEFDTDDDHSVYNNQPAIESNSDPKSSASVSSIETRNIKMIKVRKPTDVNLVVLPVPGIKEQQMEEDAVAKCDIKLKAGFIPSLFLSINDHYVSDMVLQGTSAPPHKWELNVREDLALATHSGSLISTPAENVAVIADMENWDVKIISSQNQTIPFSSVVSGPVGMSQLVASMLETVYTMNSSGIPAYECLSFLESKLQEIYMHSESLASFLLATDFCSLSAVTTALNLTENDVPLLLSIASIHTPQITKKCGISFR